MASSSGTSSGSSQASDEKLQAVMDQKKKKRMLSNRESARRSRMRKQKHLDDLMAQVNQLRKDNSQILTTLNFTTQHYLSVEAENSVLRTQMMELSSRLQSLNEIIQSLNGYNRSSGFVCDGPQFLDSTFPQITDNFLQPWNYMHMNQPIVASADMLLNYNY